VEFEMRVNANPRLRNGPWVTTIATLTLATIGLPQVASPVGGWNRITQEQYAAQIGPALVPQQVNLHTFLALSHGIRPQDIPSPPDYNASWRTWSAYRDWQKNLISWSSLGEGRGKSFTLIGAGQIGALTQRGFLVRVALVDAKIKDMAVTYYEATPGGIPASPTGNVPLPVEKNKDIYWMDITVVLKGPERKVWNTRAKPTVRKEGNMQDGR